VTSNCKITATRLNSSKIALPLEIHIAPEDLTPTRIQEYGVGIFISAPTKSALKKALKRDQIQVNGKVAQSATYVSGGDRIEFFVAHDERPKNNWTLEIKVLYEDDYLAAVYKPAGLLVSGNSKRTLAKALPSNLSPSTQPDATLPQPVHRLDYGTTGLVLVGKTSSAIRQLNKLFENKEIHKTYHSITIGTMPITGLLNEPVDGKEALTRYHVLQSVSSERFGVLNLVEVKPETGRRHQIRIHLSQLGNPILGDANYSPPALLLKGKGMYLNASALQFVHPFNGEPMSLETELPDRFRKIFSSEK